MNKLETHLLLSFLCKHHPTQLFFARTALLVLVSAVLPCVDTSRVFDGVVCSSAAHTVPASACVSATRRTRSGHTHCVDREGERGGEGDNEDERNMKVFGGEDGEDVNGERVEGGVC